MTINGDFSPTVNPTNGSISGRGLANRKLTREQLVSMAADYKTGQLQVDPSFKHACALFGVSPADLRKELKRRAEANAAANESTPLSDEAAYFVAVWSALSATDREAAVKAMGVAEVWDVLSRVVA
jgi:hypothetical protein